MYKRTKPQPAATLKADQRQTYCVDFDGVIAYHENEWPVEKIGHMLFPGAELIRKLKKQGYEVVILTARPVEQHQAIHDWLVENVLNRYVDRITNVKPPAVAYVDDKAIAWPKNKE